MMKIYARLITGVVLLMLVLVGATVIIGRGNDAPLEIIGFSTPTQERGVYLSDGRAVVKIADSVVLESPAWSRDGRLAWHSIDRFHIHVWERGKVIEIDESLSLLKAWSDDGRLMVVGNVMDDNQQPVYVWDGVKLTHIGGKTPDAIPVWSRDGRLAWVDSSGNRDIFVWDGETTINISQHPGMEGLPAWSDDGRLAWIRGVNRRWSVLVWDGENTVEIQESGTGLFQPLWSADGYLAWVSIEQNTHVYVWDGEQVVDLIQQSGANTGLSWSKDGRLAWSVRDGGRGQVYVWDGEQIRQISDQSVGDGSPVWSPQGYLAWNATKNGSGEIFVWDGQAVINASQHPGHDYSPQWLADNSLVWMHEFDYSTGGSVYQWRNGETTLVNIVGRQYQIPAWYFP